MVEARGGNHRPRSLQRREAALRAIAHLRAADPRLAVLIESVGAYRPIITNDPFRALVASILQQQVSMAAGATIYRRLRAACAPGRLTPEVVMGLTPMALRAIGLSRQKAAYVHNVAKAFADGTLSARALRRMSDEEVLAATTALKGIGRWTAEMLLIFCLERGDVWPIDDLGLKKAVQRFLEVPEVPAPAALRALAEPWRPYRTYATWYLWRSLEGPLMPGIPV